MPEIPFAISITFVALTVFLWLQCYMRLRPATTDKGRRFALFSIGWLCLTFFLARSGFLAQFDTVPPRFVFMMIPIIIFLVLLGFRKKFVPIAKALPQSWLIYLQSFRIVMELILWWLFTENIIPVQMSFEGRNMDILVGLTAIPVGYIYLKNPTANKRLLLAWNIIGMLILTNIVLVAATSTPTLLRVFMNEPANTIIAAFPFVWLPAFVVPVAYCLHILSIRKLLND